MAPQWIDQFSSLAGPRLREIFDIVPAHLVWLLERGKPDGIIPEPSYLPGIFRAS